MLLVLMLGAFGATQGQWSSSSGNTTTTDKVGIGTTSPNNPLVVSGGANAYSSVVQNTAAAGTSFGLIVDAGGNSSDYALRIRQRTGGNELFAVRGDGNVGIGTTSPRGTLDIGGSGSVANSLVFGFSSSEVTALRLANTRTQNYADGLIGKNLSGVANGSSDNYFTPQTTSGAGYNGIEFRYGGNIAVFAAHGATTANETITPSTRLFIEASTGNVGIGTTSPGVTLDVYNSSNYPLSVRSTGDSFTGILGLGQASGVAAIQPFTSGYGAYRNLSLVPGGGNVGIGTTSPSSRLQVTGAITSTGNAELPSAVGGQVLWTGGYASPESARFIFGDGSGWKMHFSKRTSGVTTNLITFEDNGNITAAGTIEAGNIKAKYQDVAEWVPASEQLSAGTVVVLDSTKSNQVTSSSVSYDTRVAGVISEQPGIALGEKSEGKVLVATTGRVRVKVDASRGPIHIGDLLVTSDVPGVAMKSEPVELAGRKMHMPGTLIGKALEPLAKGKSEILVLLSLQ
jgi:hypothetical protein